ncbi:DNA lyase Apn2 [Talaromyces proteolyticus]|uniref:DNA-(apurinic or apyrimidinic site) endonuclease 2 n=1 Tax=Talaromyces proteolyticus TaxID=1131652 RepID=A0AAD4L006_9EURO|nr:DNA lyase Apn2 [Talaromyces proteolyticus]KAH8703733.1 DNA lyase Apn2 [Talaromyces proteolyticus]
MVYGKYSCFLPGHLASGGLLIYCRNPFGYQPWRDNRSFDAMFDILEADIVVFQETKIQRKDLRDDMVLIPGWDCFFSLPKHKKGYSGVVIYTRNASCAPIRAEEGITGFLCPPNSTTPFRELPDDQQIGGYPSIEQLSDVQVEAATLDCEGRCVVLEFPAFVLLGVYSPAARDETRDDFRHGFVSLLDARIRNLVSMGKRVILTGDLNISTGEIDSAHLTEAIRKGTGNEEEYLSSPVRRIFNQLVEGTKVISERDEGRETPALYDICRSFHPGRRGMYTCWETRVNARPGNYGARIDYVLSSLDMKDWWADSNIQEGLMGSDHCPVFAVFNDKVLFDGVRVDIHDIVNPPGVFKDGERQREYSTKDLLPLSGRLIPEFNSRRSIKDMFFGKPSSLSSSGSRTPENAPGKESQTPTIPEPNLEDAVSLGQTQSKPTLPVTERTPSSLSNGTSKRLRAENISAPPPKRTKSSGKSESSKGQQSLMGFFRPKQTAEAQPQGNNQHNTSQTSPTKQTTSISEPSTARTETSTSDTQEETIIDPIVSKESWSKLFTKKEAPKCEEHQEPCMMMTTKKAGVNCGRSFWMCSRPLGPTGQKEKGTQWRCGTFIWASDWNG